MGFGIGSIVRGVRAVRNAARGDFSLDDAGDILGFSSGGGPSGADFATQRAFQQAEAWVRLAKLATADLDVGIAAPIDRGDSRSAVYSWKGIETSYGIGQSVAIAYGEHDIGGQVISSSVDLLTAAESELQVDVERLNTLLALCEGPIESIGGVNRAVNGATNITANRPFPQNIRVNGIAQNGGVEMSLRRGELYQTPIPGFEASRTTVSVGGELEQRNQEAIATVAFPEATQIRLRFTFTSGLRRQSNSGQFGERVEFVIQWRARRTGTPLPWSSPTTYVVEPGFARTNEFSTWAAISVVPGVEPGFDGYDVRVQRLTDIGEQRAPTDEFITDFAVWEEFEAIVEERFSHPRTALFAIRLPANDILRGGQPQYQIPGRWRKLRVYDAPASLEPSADRFWTLPESGPYSGIWSHDIGRNPAWIAADFIGVEFGLGRNNLEIDWPAFRDWADFCDQDAPEGGPLCACDIVTDRPTNEWDVLLRIFRAGRAVPLLDGQRIRPVYEFRDAHGRGTNIVPAKQRVAIVAEDNVAGFSMAYLPTHQRPNLYAAQFLNRDLAYEIDTAIVEDTSEESQAFGLTRQVPTRKVQTEFLGVTSKAQAERELRLRAESNKLATKRCVFTASPEMLRVQVGDILGVAHDVTRPSDKGGPVTARLTSDVTGRAFTIDKPVTITGGAHSMVVQGIRANGSPGEWVIASGAGIYNPGDSLETSASMAEIDLPAGSVVVVGAWDGDAAGNGTANGVEDFIVTQTQLNPDGSRTVQARLWVPEAFDVDTAAVPESEPLTDQARDELGIAKPSTTISPTVMQPATSSVSIQPGADGRGHEIAWQMPATSRGKSARVYLDDASGNPQLLGESRNGRLYVGGLDPSRAASIRVAVEDRDGTFATVGNITPTVVQPSEFRAGSMHPLTGVTAQSLNDGRVVVRWNPIPGDDVQFVEVRRGEFWEGATVISRTERERVTVSGLIPTQSTRLLLRAHYAGGLPGPISLIDVIPVVPDGMELVTS